MEAFDIRLIGTGCPLLAVEDITNYQTSAVEDYRRLVVIYSLDLIVYSEDDADKTLFEIDTHSEGLADVDTNQVYMFAVPVHNVAPVETIPDKYVLYTSVDNSGTGGLGIGYWKANTAGADYTDATDWDAIDATVDDLVAALLQAPPGTDLPVHMFDLQNIIRTCGIPTNKPNITNIAYGSNLEPAINNEYQLIWTSSPEALYDLYIGPTDGAYVLHSEDLPLNTAVVFLSSGIEYKVKVIAKNVYGDNEGDEIVFTISSCGLIVPELIFPMHNEQIGNQHPIFRWRNRTPVDLIDNNALQVQELIGGAWVDTFSTLNAGTGETYTMQELLTNNKSYRWRVGVISGSNMLFSSWGYFSVLAVTSLLGKVTLVSPVDGASIPVGLSRMVTFSWQSLAGAAKYMIRIYEDILDPPIIEAFTTGTELSLDLFDIEDYIWCVIPINAEGVASIVAPDMWDLNIQTQIVPSPVVWLNPVQDTIVIGDTASFEVGANTSLIRYAYGSVFSNMISVAEGDIVSIAGLPLGLHKLIVWRYYNYDSQRYQSDKIIRVIERDSLDVPVVKINGLTPPIVADVDTVVNVTWESVPGAETYKVEITPMGGDTVTHRPLSRSLRVLLAPETEYTIIVTAEAGDVASSSNHIDITTVPPVPIEETVQWVVAKLDCYKYRLIYHGISQEPFIYQVRTYLGELIQEGEIPSDQTEVDITLPERDDVYFITIGEREYEHCLVIYELCNIIDCMRKMITSMMCDTGCIDSPITMNCDEMVRIQEADRRFAFARFSVLYTELMMLINVERVKYMYVETYDTTRLEYIKRVGDVLEFINSTTVRCGFC